MLSHILSEKADEIQNKYNILVETAETLQKISERLRKAEQLKNEVSAKINEEEHQEEMKTFAKNDHFLREMKSQQPRKNFSDPHVMYNDFSKRREDLQEKAKSMKNEQLNKKEMFKIKRLKIEETYSKEIQDLESEQEKFSLKIDDDYDAFFKTIEEFLEIIPQVPNGNIVIETLQPLLKDDLKSHLEENYFEPNKVKKMMKIPGLIKEMVQDLGKNSQEYFAKFQLNMGSVYEKICEYGTARELYSQASEHLVTIEDQARCFIALADNCNNEDDTEFRIQHGEETAEKMALENYNKAIATLMDADINIPNLLDLWVEAHYKKAKMRETCEESAEKALIKDLLIKSQKQGQELKKQDYKIKKLEEQNSSLLNQMAELKKKTEALENMLSLAQKRSQLDDTKEKDRSTTKHRKTAASTDFFKENSASAPLPPPGSNPEPLNSKLPKSPTYN